MTPFQRLARGIVERAAGSFYEGPEPPERLGEIVVAFANEHPHATRAEWVAFVIAHGGECYRSGYVRGFERAERDYRDPEISPEDTADSLDPDWRWQPGIELTGEPDDVVMEVNDEDQMSADEIRRYQDSVIERNRRRTT